MRKLRTRLIAIAMAALLVGSFAACNGNDSPGGGGDKSSNTGTTSSDTSKADDKESKADDGDTADDGTAAGDVDTSKEVEVTMLVLGNRPVNGRMEAAVAAENELYKEKINATLKLEYIEWTDWQSQYNLRMASNDSSLDLITTATDWLYAWPISKKGGFMPLTEDMLSTYAPKTWEAVPAEHWDACKLGDDIFFIPEDQYTQWTNHGMFYRGDWAKEAGLEDGIHKFDDLEVYFQYVKDNKDGVIPWDIAGKNNVAGIVGGYIQSNSDYQGLIGTETGQFNLFEYKGNDSTKVVSSYYDDDIMYDAAETFKRWNDAGFWREDVLNYEGETRELFYAGKSGADQHHVETFVGSIADNMEKKQPDSEPNMYWWGEENGNYRRDLITHGAMAINAASQNPERALMLYDLLRNDKEIYQLHNYGIEGVDYVLTDDGKLDHPEGWDQSQDSLDTNFWAGRVDEYQIPSMQWYSGRDEMFAELDKNAQDYPLIAFTFDPEQMPSQLAAVSDVCARYFPAIAYGKVDDPKAAVDEFRAELEKAGFEELRENIQTQLDEALAQ